MDVLRAAHSHIHTEDNFKLDQL